MRDGQIEVTSGAVPTTEELVRLTASLQAKRQRTATLRREHERAMTDDTQASSHILGLLDGRARIDCLRLTDLMYRKLPIELREVVYRFLCIEDQPIPVGPYYHFRPYHSSSNNSSGDQLASALSIGRSLIDHREGPSPDILMPDSHIFKSTYVKTSIAQEMREAYFNNNTFSICNVDMGIFNFVYGRITDTSTLSPPSHTYPGGRVASFRVDRVEDLPAFQFANKLQLRLKYEHMNAAITKDVPVSPLARRETFANECAFLRNSKNSLSSLQCMQAGHKTLEIEFIIMTAIEEPGGEERRFINILQSLRNTIYALKYDRKDSRIKVIHHDEHISSFPRNITALWSLTREQWEYEKKANKDKQTWDADFYLSPSERCDVNPCGGFCEHDMDDFLQERWGISNALQDTRPKWPIKEGKYWPVGNGPPGWW
ncbi:hypothetical protein IQ06DRAFT_263626 [Phaeosphaeriaceae sp. SRC1lsM3a]|nr:hypothetical protein IQ06DRAFT_263626 [Stagonospora sp. SRC1lsM3a]